MILFSQWFLSLPPYAKQYKNLCTLDTLYRQFDFWIGDWDVYGIKGTKAGEKAILP
jgi:hypothetical protein